MLLLDWQNWGVNLGAYDLAYLIGFLCCPHNGSVNIRELVQGYHSSLINLGITSYPWPELWHDFKMFSIRNMYEPIGRWNMGMDESQWRPLALSTIAVGRELRCEEIF